MTTHFVLSNIVTLQAAVMFPFKILFSLFHFRRSTKTVLHLHLTYPCDTLSNKKQKKRHFFEQPFPAINNSLKPFFFFLRLLKRKSYLALFLDCFDIIVEKIVPFVTNNHLVNTHIKPAKTPAFVIQTKLLFIHCMFTYLDHPPGVIIRPYNNHQPPIQTG